MVSVSRQYGWRRAVKRAADVLLTLPTLLVLSLPLLLVALLVRLRIGRPILFRQPRIGKDGRQFELVKFRTMTEAKDPSGRLLPDGERLTTIGAMLRGCSLDELPQLWNVLRGDMSLVGPRPLLVEYLDRYSPEQSRRHEVLPGITGWVQINGRNALGWEEKFALDIWYVDHWSLWLDLRILFMTVWRVLRRDGISNHGHQTMPEFMGAGEGHDCTPDGTQYRKTGIGQ